MGVGSESGVTSVPGYSFTLLHGRLPPLPTLLVTYTVSSSPFRTAQSVWRFASTDRFCPGCGNATAAVWGGWKRACLPDQPSRSPERPPCVSKKGVHNFAYRE